MEKKNTLFSVTVTREIIERITILVKAENKAEACEAAENRMNENPFGFPIETERCRFQAYAADACRVANVGQAADLEA